MLLLASTSDLLRVVTSAAVDTDVHATFADLNGTTVTPGRTNTAISTATTTTVVGSPGSSTYRSVKTMTVRNKHATTAQTTKVLHTDGTTAVELIEVVLSAGDCLHYHEGAGFWVSDRLGRTKSSANSNGSAAAVNALQIVVLGSDVTNNNGTANTIQDVTGLEFTVTAGEGYWFRFNIWYTCAATTTGSRWSINGPGSPTSLAYRSQSTSSAAAGTDQETHSTQITYDTPAASSANSGFTGGNIALIEGFIQPSAGGTVIARFASEVSASAIVAKAGSVLEWVRVF